MLPVAAEVVGISAAKLEVLISLVQAALEMMQAVVVLDMVVKV